MTPTKRPSSSTVVQLESSSSSREVKRVRKKPISSSSTPCEKTAEQEQLRTAAALAQWRLDSVRGGEVFYQPKFIDCDTAKGWYEQLDRLEIWYHPKLKVYGKEVSQSRSIAAYAKPQVTTVKYSGHQVTLHYTYPPVLTEIQTMVEERLGIEFNHVMLNRYADGKEYIGRHRDTRENRVIASLSLGAARTFVLTPNANCPASAAPHSLVLENGSLLVMQGDTQTYWKHEIPKEPAVKHGRISLTFRQLSGK